MVKILYQERNEKLAGEGSKHPLEGEGSSGGKKDDDHSKKGHGGNGDPPPPSSPPSSSSSSSSSVHKHRSSGKSLFLKLDVKFELPMFNGEVNAKKLDNWIRQLEVYLRIQNMHDDAAKIQLASLRMDGAALVWWEAKTKEEIKKFGKVTLTWIDFLLAIKKQFYPLAHMQKAIMNWQNFRQLKGQNVQDYTQEFRRRALLLGVDLQTQDTLLKYIGGLHSYLRHTILMFNPTSLDEVCVQATHLEARGKNTFEEGHEEKNCWKLHPEKKPQFNKSKGKQKTAATTSTPQDLGDDSGDETKIIAMGLKNLKGKEMEIQASTSTSNCHVQAPNEEEIIELFHVRVISKHTKIDTLFDSGSQANLISEELVKQVKLETVPHPKPYPLGWICKDANLQVTRKCTLRFAITAHLIDTVELDVAPFDIAGIVLGSPYLFDRKAIFHRHENKYHLFKDGKEFIVRAHRKKTSIEMVNAGQVKRLVNSSKNFVLLMFKPKVDVNHESFDNCDPKLKSDMYDVVDVYHEMFQEPTGASKKIQHGNPFASILSSSNIGMYRLSIMENVEIKEEIKTWLDKGFHKAKYFAMWVTRLKDARYFTKLDLRSGYHQVRIEESDIWKTAFKTKQGLFEWLMMPFGLCNALATFMRVMDDVLRPFLDDFVIFYLDDILIFSKSREDHVMHVRKVLDVLNKNQLFLKMSKCEFGKTSLVYLGHIVGGGTLRIDPAKIEAIVNFPTTKSITEVRSFLGAAQYWRKFVSNFSSIVVPMHAVTSVKHAFQWGGKQQKYFESLKENISSSLVLALPNLRQPFEIQTDASDYAMGAVLLQHGKPIVVHSETFNGVVVNYPTYDKELYALVQSVKKWKHYLMGKETVIHTDHQPLQYL
eukprot:PITA_10660